MLLETFIVLALWLALIWIFDPDGFRRRDGGSSDASRTTARIEPQGATRKRETAARAGSAACAR